MYQVKAVAVKVFGNKCNLQAASLPSSPHWTWNLATCSMVDFIFSPKKVWNSGTLKPFGKGCLSISSVWGFEYIGLPRGLNPGPNCSWTNSISCSLATVTFCTVGREGGGPSGGVFTSCEFGACNATWDYCIAWALFAAWGGGLYPG